MQGTAYPVWPRPQEIHFREGVLALDRPLRVVVQGEAEWLNQEAPHIVDVLNSSVGRPLVAWDGAGPTLTLATMAGLPPSLEPVPRSEGYVLSVGPEGVLLAGEDASGLFYGAQTLAQLLRGGECPSLPAVSIRDWPAYSLRGAHVYMPPRAHLDFFWRFLDFLASFKYNLLVLEIGGGMEYDKHPEINEAWRRFCREAMAYDPKTDPHKESMASRLSDRHPTGPCALQGSRYFPKDSIHPELGGGDCLTKEEVRRIVAECARRHIEIVPEVQSLSHSYYLCVAHPEIAERADDPWPDTYCPSNPRSYEILFDVMDEVIEVIHPRIVSIGHDEVYTLCVCPRCRERDAHELLAEEITRCHDHLAQHGVRTMMWGDKLMNITTPDGARYGGVEKERTDPVTGKRWFQPATYKAAERIPKDILIADWYWSLDPQSERNFHQHGFEEIYGNFSPLNFKEWEKRAGVPYVLGAEISSWCEVSPYAFGHNGTFYPFFPGADMLWHGRQMPREEVCALMARRMTPVVEWLTEQNRWLVSGGKGVPVPVDLTGESRPLPQSLAGQVKCGASVTTVLGTGPFSLLANPQGVLERALVLDRENPQVGPIAIGQKVERLLLLQGTTMENVYFRPTYYSFHRGPAVLLEYEVVYADAQVERFVAIYGEDLGPMVGRWPTPNGGYCFQAVPVEAGEGHTLFAQEWANPRPGVPVRHIRVRLGPDAVETGEVIVAAIGAVA